LAVQYIVDGTTEVLTGLSGTHAYPKPGASKVSRSCGACGQRIDPRVEHGRARLLIVAHIARHDGQSVMERRRRNDEIRLRERMARLAERIELLHGWWPPTRQRVYTRSHPSG